MAFYLPLRLPSASWALMPALLCFFLVFSSFVFFDQPQSYAIFINCISFVFHLLSTFHGNRVFFWCNFFRPSRISSIMCVLCILVYSRACATSSVAVEKCTSSCKLMKVVNSGHSSYHMAEASLSLILLHWGQQRQSEEWKVATIEECSHWKLNIEMNEDAKHNKTVNGQRQQKKRFVVGSATCIQANRVKEIMLLSRHLISSGILLRMNYLKEKENRGCWVCSFWTNCIQKKSPRPT